MRFISKSLFLLVGALVTAFASGCNKKEPVENVSDTNVQRGNEEAKEGFEPETLPSEGEAVSNQSENEDIVPEQGEEFPKLVEDESSNSKKAKPPKCVYGPPPSALNGESVKEDHQDSDDSSEDAEETIRQYKSMPENIKPVAIYGIRALYGVESPVRTMK